MNVIELKKISKVFTDTEPATIVLDNINLAVAKGEFVAIMGPSGSGKSTLMNIIGLLDTPTDGQYLLDGKPVTNMKDRTLAHLRRDKIGFIFQSFNLIPRLSVVQNVELPMTYARVSTKSRHKHALELLEKVGLTELANKRPNKISGGQVQRVAIARALANKPSLILADEPTGNLDSKTGAAVLDLLSGLHKEGATIVMITHDRDVAERAERTIIIRDGRVDESGAKGAKK